jgi:diguanylate cyclase (GGDEF)-like protein
MTETTAYRGLHSFRSRYIAFALVAVLSMLLFAFYSWFEISRSSLITRQNILDRNRAEEQLKQVIDQFHQVRVQVYQFSLDPEITSKGEVIGSLFRLVDLASEVDIRVFDEVDAEALNDFIIQIPLAMHQASVRLVTIRSNNERWIPATANMFNEMLPINERVRNLFNEMRSDLEGDDNPEAHQLLIDLLDLRNLWSLIVSEFRLLAANRLGIFGRPSETIERRIENLYLLLDSFDQKLDGFNANISSDDYFFVKSYYLPQLKKIAREWRRISEDTIQSLRQSDWRRDIAELSRLEDLMQRFNQLSLLLQRELQRQSVRDIQNLNRINEQFARAIMILTLGGLLFAILGYLFMSRNMLRPIERLRKALYLQSQGMSQSLEVSAKTSEMQDLVMAFNQMSRRIRNREHRLDYIAHHDALTQLPNRLMFNQRLDHALKLNLRNRHFTAIMLLDLDRFKLINDSLGHLFGDKLLQQTAQRLRNCLREEDTIARLGGDEFAIIIENLEDREQAEILAHKIIRLFQRPYDIDGQEIHASTSIGIALAPLHGRDPETLLRYADIAMYQSKTLGRNQYSLFDTTLENSEQSLINFENELREAITGNQFLLHYQPIIDLRNPGNWACEALLRWQHPTRGLLYPGSFLGLLENRMLMFDLTCWVIRKALDFQQQMKASFGIRPRVSINLASAIFSQQRFRESVTGLLLELAPEPGRVVLEITEDTLLSDMRQSSSTLQKLHQAGFLIALDDFGTGQSSLSHLRAFPIDIIKIDREFVQDIGEDEQDARLVSAILLMGRELDKEVIAEGVEQQHQLDFLSRRGCHRIQGFLFSRPLPEAEYRDLLLRQIRVRRSSA